MDITAKEISFVIEYTKDFVVSRAAVASGYSASAGANLMKKPEVQAAIDEVLARRAAKSDINAEWLLGELVDNHYIARQAGDIKASTAALGLIAKQASVDSMASDKLRVEPVTIHLEGDELKDV